MFGRHHQQLRPSAVLARELLDDGLTANPGLARMVAMAESMGMAGLRDNPGAAASSTIVRPAPVTLEEPPAAKARSSAPDRSDIEA